VNDKSKNGSEADSVKAIRAELDRENKIKQQNNDNKNKDG
jgi:hypothetical protein